MEVSEVELRAGLDFGRWTSFLSSEQGLLEI